MTEARLSGLWRKRRVHLGITSLSSSCWQAASLLATMGGLSLAGILAAGPTGSKGGIARRVIPLFVIVAAVLLVEAVVVHRYIVLTDRYESSAWVASGLESDSKVIELLASGSLYATEGESGARSIGVQAANELKASVVEFQGALDVLRDGGSLGGRELPPAPDEISNQVEELDAAWAKARPFVEKVAASPDGSLPRVPPELGSSLTRLRSSSSQLAATLDSRDESSRDEVRYVVGVAVFAGFGALFITFAFAWTRIVGPMRRLRDQALAMVELSSSSVPADEIEAVSRAVAEMASHRDRLRQERARMTEKLRRAEADYQSIFDNAVAGIVRFDDKGQVLLANHALAKMLGFESEDEVEASVSDVHRQLFEDPNHRARFEELHRKRGRVELESKARRKDGTTLWVLESSRAAAAAGGSIVYEAVVVDITPMKKAQESLRELSGLLLQSQDSERRRIARELHDSTGQLLAALEMNLGRLDEVVPVLRESVSSSMALASECNRQIRSMSYLLHPPMLEELGLLYALRDYCRGFSARSKIDVTLDTPPELARLDADAELALFRVVQEALTNIQRHAGSNDAIVRIHDGTTGIRLEVEDHGCGIPSELLGSNGESGLSNMGVGIRGMEERLRQLGGRLTIESEPGRTQVRAELPQPTEVAHS